MLAILSIIIGIVFVLLLFSMLTSAVVEVIHAAFSYRGRHLRDTLEIMLGPEASRKFLDHSYFRQLSSATKPHSGQKLPIWIGKGTFSAILADILTEKGNDKNIQQRIDSIQNDDLRKVLDFLWRQSGQDVAVFQEKVENWYGEVMERAKDWFADATKWRLFFIGLTLAAILNADTLQIYKSLSVNAAARDELVNTANAFAAARAKVPGIDTLKTVQQAQQDFLEVKKLFVESVQSPLGLGWGQSLPQDIWAWLIKLIGWTLTGVAVTLGAPFWFDLLRKLLSLRGGAPAAEPPASQASTTQQKSVFEMESAGKSTPAEEKRRGKSASGNSDAAG